MLFYGFRTHFLLLLLHDISASYLKKFKRLPNHEVNVMISLFIDSVSSEECARRCILEIRFRCRGFNYQFGNEVPRCLLVESTTATGSQAAMFSQTSDFYEKETGIKIVRSPSYQPFATQRLCFVFHSFFHVPCCTVLPPAKTTLHCLCQQTYSQSNQSSLGRVRFRFGFKLIRPVWF